jgi:hypothetical protein
VAQATVKRNSAQTAADAAALAAARHLRDESAEGFLKALLAGDVSSLGQLLGDGTADDLSCPRDAAVYAEDNEAELTGCQYVDIGGAPGFTVSVRTKGTVGDSVVPTTEDIHVRAHATAVVTPRCSAADKAGGHAIDFTCADGRLTVDPTAGDFTLDLSDFFSVHLSKAEDQ